MACLDAHLYEIEYRLLTNILCEIAKFMWKYSRLSIWCFKTLDISQTKKCIYKSFHPFLLGILVIVIIASYISYVGIKQIIPSDQKEKTSQECYLIYCFIQKFVLVTYTYVQSLTKIK
jgi:hypothetical protein